MLKKSLLLTAAACSLCAALALAQEVPPVEKTAAAPSPTVVKKTEAAMPVDSASTDKPHPKPTPKAAKSAPITAPVPEVIATPTPKPKKPSFFERIFGTRKPKATPAPVPTPTPSPTPRKIVRKVPAATPTPAPEPGSTPKPGKTEPVKIAPVVSPEKPPTTPKPVKPAATPKLDVPKVAPATPAKKTTAAKPAITEPRKALPEPPADADPEVKEKFHFEQAKAKAAEDPQVKSLKAKADDASTDEDSRKALRAYNKALFEKIRKIDSSVSDRADRLEAAILKRLSD
jgi:hypothetical protein